MTSPNAYKLDSRLRGIENGMEYSGGARSIGRTVRAQNRGSVPKPPPEAVLWLETVLQAPGFDVIEPSSKPDVEPTIEPAILTSPIVCNFISIGPVRVSIFASYTACLYINDKYEIGGQRILRVEIPHNVSPARLVQ